MKTLTKTIHEVDAAGKSIGRVASAIARLLQGKHSPMYTPNIDSPEFVVVRGAAKVKITGSKLEQKHIFIIVAIQAA